MIFYLNGLVDVEVVIFEKGNLLFVNFFEKYKIYAIIKKNMEVFYEQ